MPQILYNNKFQNISPTAELGKLYEKYIVDDELNKIMLIVPTGKLVKKYTNNTIRKYHSIHNKPCEKPAILTLQSLIHFCFEKLYSRNNYRLISEAFRLVLFEEAASIANLKFFANEKQNDKSISSAILLKLSNIIYGLKEDGISVESIREDFEKFDDNNEIFDEVRYNDIYALYEAYTNLLGEKLIDGIDMLNLVNKPISKSINPTQALSPSELAADNPLNSILNNHRAILFTGFSEFKQPEIEFIGYFASATIPTALFIDFSEQNGPLFGNLQDTIAKLYLAGFKKCDNGNKGGNQNKSEYSRSDYIRRWLFNTEKAIENPNFKGIIKIFAANNKYEELISIARLIRWQHQVKNVPLNSICVVMRQPEIYSQLFREIFQIAAIPVNVSDRYKLSSSGITVAIFSVLDLLRNNYRREDLNRVLQSPYLNFQDVDSVNLYQNALEMRITGDSRLGTKLWEKRFIDKNQLYSKWLNELENSELEHDSTSIKIKLEKLNKAHKDFNKITSILPQKPGMISAAQFATFVKKQIIMNLKIKDNIISFFNSIRYAMNESKLRSIILEDEAEKDGRALTEFVEILDEMCFILENRNPQKKYNYDELVHKLRTLVSGAKYQIYEKRNFGVNITAIEQSRGIPYQVVILCGTLDRQFPIPYRPEVFLGKELDKSEVKQKEAERMLFYQFLTNNTELLDDGKQNLYIFYPKSDENNELVRSSFIDDLMKIISADSTDYCFDLNELKDKYTNDVNDDKYWINSVVTSGELISYCDYKEINNIITNSKSDFRLLNFANGTHHILNTLTERLKIKEKGGLLHQQNITDDERTFLIDLTDKPISATDLEKYAGCPYQYFVEKVLRIRNEPEPEIQLTPIEQGNILHSILYKFYKQLQLENDSVNNNSIVLFPRNNELPVISGVLLNNSYLAYYRELLINKIAVNEIEKYRFDNLFFQINMTSLIGDENNPGLLVVWLKNEMHKIEDNWAFQPILFELAFGIKNAAGQYIYDAIQIDDNLTIAGKVDRVEINLDYEKEKFIIADYKFRFSDFIPTDKAISKGLSFQMPFYTIAVNKILNENYVSEIKSAGAVYYAIEPKFNKRKNKPETIITVLVPNNSPLITYENIEAKDVDVEELISNSILYAKSYLQNISLGDFPVLPTNNRCKFCTFQNICRINDNR